MAKNIFTRYDNIKKLAGEGSPYAVDCYMQYVVKFSKDDRDTAVKVEPLEEVIDDLVKEMKKRHIDRLRQGNCSMEAGLLLEDILTNYERVSDHCSNIAIVLLEIHEA